jgi:hypothetical protein
MSLTRMGQKTPGVDWDLNPHNHRLSLSSFPKEMDWIVESSLIWSHFINVS